MYLQILVLYIYCILWSGTSHVVVILVTRAVSCIVLFSSCVGVVAVYLFYVYICLLLVIVYLCSVYRAKPSYTSSWCPMVTGALTPGQHSWFVVYIVVLSPLVSFKFDSVCTKLLIPESYFFHPRTAVSKCK